MHPSSRFYHYIWSLCSWDLSMVFLLLLVYFTIMLCDSPISVHSCCSFFLRLYRIAWYECTTIYHFFYHFLFEGIFLLWTLLYTSLGTHMQEFLWLLIRNGIGVSYSLKDKIKLFPKVLVQF